MLTVEIKGAEVTLHVDDEGADMLAAACEDVKGPSKVFLGSRPFLILRHLDYPIDWGNASRRHRVKEWDDFRRVVREGHIDPRRPRQLWGAFRRALGSLVRRGAVWLDGWVSPR